MNISWLQNVVVEFPGSVFAPDNDANWPMREIHQAYVLLVGCVCSADDHLSVRYTTFILQRLYIRVDALANSTRVASLVTE